MAPPLPGILSNAYDDDGNGHISTKELVKAAELSIKVRKYNIMLWKGIGLAAFIVVALIGLNAGLTYGIIDANKDTEVQGRALMVREKGMDAELPVTTSNNEIVIFFFTYLSDLFCNKKPICWLSINPNSFVRSNS